MTISIRNEASGVSTASRSEEGTATVQTSETTLAQVAERLGIPEPALKEANPQINPQKLQVGQDIKLPENSTQNSSADEFRSPTNESKNASRSKMAEQNIGSLARQIQMNTTQATKGVTTAQAKILNDQLLDATSKNDLKKMENLIQQGADVNAKDDRGRTPLMLASEAGNIKTMETLVKKHKANVNAKDNDGQTAVAKAVINNKNDAVKSLVDLKANVDIKDNLNKTPLLHAAQRGNTEAVKTLLHEGGADPDIKDKDGRTALMEAIQIGTFRDRGTEMIRELAQHSNPDLQDNKGSTALMLLMRRQQTTGEATADPVALKSLIEGSKKLDAQDENGRTALMEAARTFDGRVAKALIDAGADVNLQDNNNKTVLMHAIENRLQVRASGFPDIDFLIERSHLDLKDNLGRSAIIQATAMGDEQMVKKLHLAGADLDLADKNGRTALIEAAQNGELNIVTALLDTSWQNHGFEAEPRPTRKADVFKKDYTYKNALSIAERELEIDQRQKDPAKRLEPQQRKNYEEIVKLLKKEMDLY